ncbi:hypothetical protein AAID94_04530 [Campylobacter coli]
MGIICMFGIFSLAYVLTIALTPDFEQFLAENQIKNSQDFADKFSDTLDENQCFDFPRILCYKENLKNTPFEDYDNEYFVFIPQNKNINFDSLSYATSTLKLLNQKELLIETMKIKIEEGEIKYISELIPIIFEGKIGKDIINF